MAWYVNGEEVSREMIDAEIERLRPDYDRMVRERNPDGGDTELRAWSRENVIERLLLRQEARRRAAAAQGEGEEGDGDRQRMEALMSEITAEVQPPADRELREFYKEHREHFKAPEQVHAAHIVKHVRGPGDRDAAFIAMLNAKAQLDQGKPFEELAAEMSDCPDRAGDLGRFGRGQMVQEFDDAVFELQPHEVSAVFESPFGYHIAKVYERHPGGVLAFDKVRESLQQRLLHERRAAAMEAFVDQLKQQATIEEK